MNVHQADQGYFPRGHLSSITQITDALMAQARRADQGFYPRGYLTEGVNLDAHQRAVLATIAAYRFLGQVYLVQGTPTEVDALEGLTWARSQDEDQPVEQVVARLTEDGWQARCRIRGLAQD